MTNTPETSNCHLRRSSRVRKAVDLDRMDEMLNPPKRPRTVTPPSTHKRIQKRHKSRSRSPPSSPKKEEVLLYDDEIEPNFDTLDSSSSFNIYSHLHDSLHDSLKDNVVSEDHHPFESITSPDVSFRDLFTDFPMLPTNNSNPDFPDMSLLNPEELTTELVTPLDFADNADEMKIFNENLQKLIEGTKNLDKFRWPLEKEDFSSIFTMLNKTPTPKSITKTSKKNTNTASNDEKEKSDSKQQLTSTSSSSSSSSSTTTKPTELKIDEYFDYDSVPSLTDNDSSSDLESPHSSPSPTAPSSPITIPLCYDYRRHEKLNLALPAVVPDFQNKCISSTSSAIEHQQSINSNNDLDTNLNFSNHTFNQSDNNNNKQQRLFTANTIKRVGKLLKLPKSKLNELLYFRSLRCSKGLNKRSIYSGRALEMVSLNYLTH